MHASLTLFFFFFNDTATTEIYTLCLHDALPIWQAGEALRQLALTLDAGAPPEKILGQLAWLVRSKFPAIAAGEDRKSTRLNSSHLVISYAVFCLKKKKKTNTPAPVPQITWHKVS